MNEQFIMRSSVALNLFLIACLILLGTSRKADALSENHLSICRIDRQLLIEILREREVGREGN
jgi:hypothetical protein